MTGGVGTAEETHQRDSERGGYRQGQTGKKRMREEDRHYTSCLKEPVSPA